VSRRPKLASRCQLRLPPYDPKPVCQSWAMARPLRIEYPGARLTRHDEHPETTGLIGVEAPQAKDPRKPVECFGNEASQFTPNCSKASGSGLKSRRSRPPRLVAIEGMDLRSAQLPPHPSLEGTGCFRFRPHSSSHQARGRAIRSPQSANSRPIAKRLCSTRLYPRRRSSPG